MINNITMVNLFCIFILSVRCQKRYIFCYQYKNETCGYRIVVKGKNDVLQLHQHKQITCYKPYDTDCYVINHTGAVHSVTNDIGRITIYISGFIDREKHLKLLKRSMNKYSEYVI